MEYNLLICTSTEKWIAIDINPNGELERLSLDGNDFAEVHSTEDVLEFCAKILGYYNINKFNDINLNVKIVMVSKYSPLISELFMHMKDAVSINLIDAKTVMPIYVLKNCLVKANRKIGILCMEERFSFIVDDDLTVSYENAEEGEELRIEPENFSIVFRFNCKNLISDEREFKELEKKFGKELETINNELEELRHQYIQLNSKKEENKKILDSRRIILKFDNQVIDLSHALHSYPQNEDIYQCKLLKSDGDIVEPETEIITIHKCNNIIGKLDFSQGEFFNSFHDYKMKTKSTGKIFYLVKDGDQIKRNDALAILSDPLDECEDIMQWYHNKSKKK